VSRTAVGEDLGARSGENSLANHGALFLDELPEFSGIMEQTDPTNY
jgi:predicted ATPase with chaperone activity